MCNSSAWDLVLNIGQAKGKVGHMEIKNISLNMCMSGSTHNSCCVGNGSIYCYGSKLHIKV